MANETMRQIAIAGFSAVGSYYLGYPGMMIGMSLANMLFPADEAQEHMPINELDRGTNTLTKLNPVPVVIGTDYTPGQITKLNNMGLVTSLDPVWSGDTERLLWEFEKIYTKRPGSDGTIGGGTSTDKAGEVKYLYANFHMVFADAYSAWTGNQYINQIMYNNYIQWDLMNLADRLKREGGYMNVHPYEADSYLDINWTDPLSIVDGERDDRYLTISYKGLFGEPTKSSFGAEFANTDIQGEDSITGNEYGVVAEKWYQFPNVKAEVTAYDAPHSTYAMARVNSEADLDYFTHTYRDSRADYVYGIFQNDITLNKLLVLRVTFQFNVNAFIQMK